MIRVPDSPWKVSKYEVFSVPYIPVFGLNTGKFGPDKTPYLDTFRAMRGKMAFI